MPKQSFIIIGSGWRSEFYIRIAKALPEHFQLKALLCRSEEKVQYFTDTYGIKATTSIQECIDLEPDFVVVAVNKSSIFEVTHEWLQQGFPVLAETPAATSLEDLQSLWHLQESGAKIQIAEQYHRYPGIAARLAVLKSKLIGEPYNVVMKRAHEYHGISMIRDILSITDETVTMTAQSFTFPVTETGNRSGAVYDGTIKEQTRNLVSLEFSNGKVAFYDFSGVQYHSSIRSYYMNVQAVRGEISDDEFLYLDEDNKPNNDCLETTLGETGHVESILFKDQEVYTNPFGNHGLEEDETAIATMMLGMKGYIDKNIEVYPLANALEDAYLTLLMQEALATPGTPISSTKQVWHNTKQSSPER